MNYMYLKIYKAFYIILFMKNMTGDKIRVKIKVRGIEVEVEAPPDQLEKAISNIISGIEKVERKSEEVVGVIPATCKEAVEMLWREGYFSQAKRLAEVWRELSERGFNYDRSALSHALSDLTKEGILTRIGKSRRYRYVQKLPYIKTT
jgi:DNA-binding transcriptional ArsR family regulator